MTTVAVYSSQPEPMSAYLNPVRMLRDLWSHRDLIVQFTRRDIAAHHKGSTLGRSWSVINPLLVLTAYGFLFGVVMPSKWQSSGPESNFAEAVLYIFCGFTTYQMFSEPVVRSCGLIVGKRQLVQRVVFPIQILPVTTMLSGWFFSLMGLMLVAVIGGIATGRVHVTVVALPLLLVALCLLAMTFAWTFAALGVFLRDLPQIMQVVVGRFLMFTTPVFYPLHAVPDRFRVIIDINPMAWIVQGMRGILIRGEWPNWTALGITIAAGAVGSCLSYAIFMKARRGFADVL